MILRRRPSTGAWEILTSPPELDLPQEGGEGAETEGGERKEASRRRGRRERDGLAVESPSLASPAGLGGAAEGVSNGVLDEQESPLPLTNHDASGGSGDLGVESHDGDVGSHDQQLAATDNGLEECGEEMHSSQNVTPPQPSLEEIPPLQLGTPLKSTPPSPLLATPPLSRRNSKLSTSSELESSISSRTRHRQASLSLSDLISSPSSSPSRHKYPTRLRLNQSMN